MLLRRAAARQVRCKSEWEERRRKAKLRRQADSVPGGEATDATRPAGVQQPGRGRVTPAKEVVGTWKPGSFRARSYSRNADGSIVAYDPALDWASDVPLSSPGGQTLTREIRRIVRGSIFRHLSHQGSWKDTTSALVLLPLSTFPQLSHAYKRAGVTPQSDNLTGVVWTFSDGPRTMYGVFTTHRKGAYHVLRKKYPDGLLLTRKHIASGADVPDLHRVGNPDADEDPQYCLITRALTIMPGPSSSAVASFQVTFGAFIEDHETQTPPATYSGEVFDWGADTDEYFVPITTPDQSPAEEVKLGKAYGYYKGGHPLQTFAKERDSLEMASEEDCVLGRASILHYKQPEVAAQAFRDEKERVKAFAEKSKAAALQGHRQVANFSFDSI
ncbi:hypothetical protein DIPPA_27737 [Diplonema papillatum]|nr:hypothetical protein DIPPA_27737 [Diplonema papillatum]